MCGIFTITEPRQEKQMKKFRAVKVQDDIMTMWYKIILQNDEIMIQKVTVEWVFERYKVEWVIHCLFIFLLGIYLRKLKII